MSFWSIFLSWLRRTPSDPVPSTSSAPVVESFSFQLSNGVHVTFTNDDVEYIEADAIVVSNDAGLTNDGSAAKSLLERGGRGYRDSFQQMKAEQSGRQHCVLRCNGGDLSCRRVYHALVDGHYRLRARSNWRQHLDELYTTVCRLAQHDGVQVVAVVLLGAGKAGGPTEDSVRAALAAFSSLPASSSLSRLLLVERDERKTRDAILECQKWTAEHPPPPPEQPQGPRPLPPDVNARILGDNGGGALNLEANIQAVPGEEVGADDANAGDDVRNETDLMLRSSEGDVRRRSNRGQRVQYADV